MTSANFAIPLNREDLLSSDSPGQYVVQELTNCKNIPRRLADCNAALLDDGFIFILNHFDALFSTVHQARELDARHILTAHNIILKGISGLSQSVPTMMQNMDTHFQAKLLNAAKMYLFLLYEVLRCLEERFNADTDKNLAVDAKSRKKAIKKFVDFDWDEKRSVTLIKLHEFLRQPLSKLWEPPVADEDFVNLAANCCYKVLEDPQVSQARLTHIKHSTLDILGILVQKYGHGLSCTVKMVQLMKLYEHLPATLAQAAVRFVREYQSRNFVREVIREITQEDSTFENSSKAYSHFLVEVAKEGPEIILPSVHLLLPELENVSYMMRNCVLGVLGEVVSGSLSKEHLSDELKEKRNIYLEQLEDHLLDGNASVRCKVLKIWQRLCQEKAIPNARLSQLLDHAVSRLEDVSWSVTRNAVQLYHSLLQSNPFGDKIEIQKLREQLQKEEQLLATLEKEINSKIPPTRAKQWNEIAPKVIVMLQEALSSQEEEENIPEDHQTNSITDNITLISQNLECGRYVEAFHLLRFAEKQSDAMKQRNNKELDWQVDYFHNLLRKIFVQFDENAEDGMRKEEVAPEHTEVQEKLLHQRTLTQFLKDNIVFAEQLDTATNKINQLLFSAQPTVILDALEFLAAAFQFGLEGALTGVKNMLMLVWSSESSVKDGVASAYKQLYIDIATHAPGRSRAGEIVRNLCNLLKSLDEHQQSALELLVREWVKSGDMDKECIQIMWERFSMKIPDTSEDDSRSALILLGMVGGVSQNILKTNISVLVSVGLGERGFKDYRLAKETCRALLKLVPDTAFATSNEELFKLHEDHEIFQKLCSLLKCGYDLFDNPFYIPMAYEAIDVIYQLSENPDRICETLLKEFCDLTKKVSSSSNFDGLLNRKGNANSRVQSNLNNSLSKIPVVLLKRLVYFIGHVAFRQWVHLDKTVFRELKRRNTIREIEAEKKQGDRQNKKSKEKRKSQANIQSPMLSRASETPRLKRDKEDAANAEVGEINADDAEAEYINHVCENEVVTGETILKSLSPIVVAVCANPQKYTNIELRNTACFALTKLMLVSSSFCEDHLTLVFTMMEKSSDPLIRSKLVYAVGDLANRFPNLIEPWTKHLYARLQDKSCRVRQDTIVVLKHLITNEMVKVRGQISDMALCIVDAEEEISVMASEFFHDLSKKGNTLYNVMPDIISRLSNPSMNVSEDHFHVILEFLLPLIHKDKQMESLVDKLCQRFRTSTTERQWSDLAFCLSLLQYSDRSLRRLTENFQYYFDKLNTPKVYDAFKSIIAQGLKTNKPERKVLIEELQSKIDDILKKGLDTETGGQQSENVIEGSDEADKSSQKENMSKKKKKKHGRVNKKQMNRRSGKRKQHSSDDEEEEEDESDQEPEASVQLQLKSRQTNRKQKK